MWRKKYKQLEKELLLPEFGLLFNWKTDGCSGVPDKLLGLNLKKKDNTGACAEHDFYYRNYNRLKLIGVKITKLQADKKLFLSIRKEENKILGFKGFFLPTLFFIGVNTIYGFKAWNDNRKKETKEIKDFKSYFTHKRINKND